MITLLLSAFTLGILGSMHCIGMCGPLVMNMPFQQVEKNKLFFATLNYHIGKTLSYALFGLIAGGIGQSFAFFRWQQVLSILSGVILLAITFMPVLKNRIPFSQTLQKWFSKLFALAAGRSDLKYFLGFGFLNGLLPCGLVYTAIAGATITTTPIQGMMFMIFFGLGTIPSLSAIILFQQKVSWQFRRYFAKSSFYLSILIACLLVLRGMNLGIPYVSPHANFTTHEMECCKKH